jgi:ribosomal protein S18 acetylase RimI-like enzyme
MLRPGEPDDAPAIAAIWHAAWRDAHLGHVSDELVAMRDEASFLTRSTQRIGDTTVAIVDGEVAGFLTIAEDEIEQIFVAAAHRGSGVADALMADGERRLKAAGHTRIWLAVVAGNARARRFYERLGWTDAGSIDYLADGNDGPVSVPAHRYEKAL